MTTNHFGGSSDDVEQPASFATSEPQVVKEEAHSWMMALLTAAHYELPEYVSLRGAVPPGGIEALVACSLGGLSCVAEAECLTMEQTLYGMALATHECMD